MLGNPTASFALSVKQPWAALIVAGLKTMEIRRWRTGRRGPILIHAAREPDHRPEAWRQVPEEWLPLSQLRGGLIGSVELTDCVTYSDLSAFLTDRHRHLNEPDWFEPPLLYGFALKSPRIEPFRRYPGWFRFFRIKEAEKSAVSTGGG